MDLSAEKDIKIDYKGFKEKLEEQREKSRISMSEKEKSAILLKNIKKYKTDFLGYDNLEGEAELQAIYVDNKESASIKEGQKGILVFDKTPFYAESGGQVGERGSGKNIEVFFTVDNTQRVHTGAFLHYVNVKSGSLKYGNRVRLSVDKNQRQNSAIHHSSTHLLHSALREVLGLHVKQAGSYVGPDKLRFDFTHFKPLSEEEIQTVEQIVNQKIRENIKIEKEIVRFEQAIEEGAIAIFEEKYSDMVRLVSVGDFSKELCGGIHLEATGEVGFFKILNESSISSGIRRIEAVAGEAGFAYIQRSLEIFENIKQHFGKKEDEIYDFLAGYDKKFKEKDKELKRIKFDKTRINPDKLIKTGIKIDEIPTVIEYIENYDRKQLGTLSDEIKNRTKGVTVLLTNTKGNSAIVVSVYPGLTKSVNASIIVKEIAKMINGNGGGREDFAQAGGETVKNIPDFKKSVEKIIKKCLK